MINGQVVTGIKQAGTSVRGEYLSKEQGEVREQATEALHLGVIGTWYARNGRENVI